MAGQVRLPDTLGSQASRTDAEKLRAIVHGDHLPTLSSSGITARMGS